uniref:Uncharacterized protein n=1 Tax=Trichogramma kaykai TaxID=54128 RepID=A0ABD2WRG8_9HYME
MDERSTRRFDYDSFVRFIEKLEQESDQISVGTRARAQEPDYRCAPIGPCALDNRGNRRAPLPATAVYHNNNASIGSSSKDTTLMQTFVQRRTCTSSCIIRPVSTRLPPRCHTHTRTRQDSPLRLRLENVNASEQKTRNAVNRNRIDNFKLMARYQKLRLC